MRATNKKREKINMNKENIKYEKNKRMYVWMKRVEKKVVKRERMREMT